MSEENMEVVRQLIDSFQAGTARRDPGVAFDLDLVTDDYEWILTEGSFEGRSVWRGREGWVEFIRTWNEQFDDLSFQAVRMIDANGDRVVVLLHQSEIGKESGIPVDWDNGVVFELKDGCVIRGTNYFSHAEALKAAGLRE